MFCGEILPRSIFLHTTGLLSRHQGSQANFKKPRFLKAKSKAFFPGDRGKHPHPTHPTHPIISALFS